MNTESQLALCRILAALGAGRPEVDEGAGLSFAWPHAKVGIAFEGAHIAPELKAANWQILVLDTATLDVLTRVLAELQGVADSERLARSAEEAPRRISSTEQTVLAALLRVGLPEPARDLEVRDEQGRYRGTVDFAWSAIGGFPVKVCLEVDGWYHHRGRDLEGTIRGSMVEREAKASDRLRSSNDAAKRQLLAEQGWQVLVVTDTQVDAGKLDRTAASVRSVISQRVEQLSPVARSDAN